MPPRKTRVGTEVAHVTHDSDTTFKVKRSKVKVTGVGHIVAAPAQLVELTLFAPFSFANTNTTRRC